VTVMKLDFSKLDGLAYRGITSEAGRETRDALVEQGFMVIEGGEDPFSGQEVLEGANIANTPIPALKRGLEPSTGIPTGRNYPAMYEAARAYHERHNPPRLTPEYWDDALKDLTSVAGQFGNDRFMTSLLSAVYGELEREYGRMGSASGKEHDLNKDGA